MITQYERPRERLQRQGASSLSLVELFQVVIGSGGAKMSGASIAKRVSRLATSSHDPLSYVDLVAISGVGQAKACLILASIELGMRLNANAIAADVEALDTSDLKSASRTVLRVQYMSGSNSSLGYDSHPVFRYPDVEVLVRAVLSKAIEKKARSVLVAIGSKNENITEPSLAVLGVIHRIYASADYLQIAVGVFELVNKKDTRSLKRRDAV